MIGAILGDIAGSKYEFNNYRSKDFKLLADDCFFTDDSIMTLAVADALMKWDQKSSECLKAQVVQSMQTIGRPYPYSGYGGNFFSWIYSDHPQPYHSFGNGAAMRVSPVAWYGNSLEEVLDLAKAVTEVSHDHPEGIKGAQATAAAIFLARTGKTKAEIKKYIEEKFYPLNFTIDSIRESYEFNETCQRTVPQALEAFLESTDFEDALRCAVSVGGDSDTLAAITGSVAEAFYGVPEDLQNRGKVFLDDRLLCILLKTEQSPVFHHQNEE